MDSEGFERAIRRLEDIEVRLRQAVQRLEALEGRTPPAREPIRDTPVYELPPFPPAPSPPTAPPAPPSPEPPPAMEWPPPEAIPQAHTATAEEQEFKLGAWLLPRLGALITLVGIGFLIALAIAEGWITPPMQYAGSVLLCLGFIALGLTKLDERAEFGYVLVGLGSGGLYLTFAGGHLYLDLYSDGVMIALFVALSFANLAFSFHRSAQSFLGMGLIGGIAAALMPLQQSSGLVIPLHFAIVVPSALIAWRQRWEGWLVFVLLLSAAPVGAYAGTAAPWEYRIGFGYANTLFLVAVMSLAFARIRDGQADEEGVSSDSAVVPALAIAASFVGGFLIERNPMHLAVFAVALIGMAVLLPKSNVQRVRIGSAAALSFLVLAPATSSISQAALWYAIEALLCAAVSLLPGFRYAATIAFCIWGLSLFAYSGDALAMQVDDLGLLLLTVISGLGVTLAVRRAQTAPVELTVTACIVGVFLFSRLGLVTLGDEHWTLTLVWTAYAAALLAVGLALRIREVRYMSLALFGLAVSKVALVDIIEVTQGARVLILMALGLAMLAAGYAYVRSRR